MQSDSLAGETLYITGEMQGEPAPAGVGGGRGYTELVSEGLFS